MSQTAVGRAASATPGPIRPPRRRREPGRPRPQVPRARAGRGALTAVALALACAAPRPRAPPAGRPAPDCASLRDDTVRACITGFQLRREGAEDESFEREVAVGEVCPYAGAVAWSGCQRGAFRRFEGRRDQGPCADRADYVESSIQTSCMRPLDVPFRAWNDLVRRCFEWAEAGSRDYAASCRRATEGETSCRTPGCGLLPYPPTLGAQDRRKAVQKKGAAPRRPGPQSSNARHEGGTLLTDDIASHGLDVSQGWKGG